MLEKIINYALYGGGLTAVGRAVWFMWTWHVARKDARAAKRAITGVDEINNALQVLIDRTPADYAHVIRIHNGGGDLDATMPIYMTCVREEHRPGFPGLRELVTGIELDKNARSMVTRLIDERDAAYPVAELKDDTLQAVFVAMGARYARSIILKIGRKGIFFLRTTSSREALDDKQFQLHYRQCVSVLKRHFKSV